MQRWTVKDRRDRSIYMTQERWEYISTKHPELTDYLDDVLNTLRRGSRRQDRRNPQTYTYRRACPRLPVPYNYIVVAVVFRLKQLPDGSTVSNNFVVSAWGKCIRSTR